MKKPKLTVLVVILVIGTILTVAFASAQQLPHPHQKTPHHDPLAQVMFPPELVMQHQREIGLTDEQKTFFRGEIQRVTLRFTELQWQLHDAMEGLASVMKETAVNSSRTHGPADIPDSPLKESRLAISDYHFTGKDSITTSHTHVQKSDDPQGFHVFSKPSIVSLETARH